MKGLGAMVGMAGAAVIYARRFPFNGRRSELDAISCDGPALSHLLRRKP